MLKRNLLTDLDQDKQTFRETARARRQVAAAGAGIDAADKLAGHMHACIADRQVGVISGYLPIADELSPLPAMAALAREGWRQALPVVVGNARPLIFRQWRDGDALEPGPLRTRHPLVGAAELRPDVVLVPMLAFDGDGQRIGWGGGFYDRTLAALRAEKDILAIGIAFAGQRVDKVPAGPHDAPLDAVLTETGAIKFREF